MGWLTCFRRRYGEQAAEQNSCSTPDPYESEPPAAARLPRYTIHRLDVLYETALRLDREAAQIERCGVERRHGSRIYPFAATTG
jgi:hypothetical protein